MYIVYRCVIPVMENLLHRNLPALEPITIDVCEQLHTLYIDETSARFIP